MCIHLRQHQCTSSQHQPSLRCSMALRRPCKACRHGDHSAFCSNRSQSLTMQGLSFALAGTCWVLSQTTPSVRATAAYLSYAQPQSSSRLAITSTCLQQTAAGQQQWHSWCCATSWCGRETRCCWSAAAMTTAQQGRTPSRTTWLWQQSCK